MDLNFGDLSPATLWYKELMEVAAHSGDSSMRPQFRHLMGRGCHQEMDGQ